VSAEERVEREAFERAVLGLLLAEGASGLTVEQLVEQIEDRPRALRALEGLLAVGLVERRGERVYASLAALRFDDLGI
jgi:predicted transcriptional regulator